MKKVALMLGIVFICFNVNAQSKAQKKTKKVSTEAKIVPNIYVVDEDFKTAGVEVKKGSKVMKMKTSLRPTHYPTNAELPQNGIPLMAGKRIALRLVEEIKLDTNALHLVFVKDSKIYATAVIYREGIWHVTCLKDSFANIDRPVVAYTEVVQ